MILADSGDLMKTRGRFASITLAVAALMIAAVACSSPDPTTTPTATTTPQPPTATPTTGPEPTTTAPAGEGQAIITSLNHDSLGDILVDNEGMTIYIFKNDEPGVSNCSGGCAAAWPPVTTVGEPLQEITTAELGTITRGDGSTQVTVNGLPVYYYSGDEERGDATGHGLPAALWFALDQSGEPIGMETANEVETDISGFEFTSNLNVTAGTTVTWTNRDGAPHTVTSGRPGSPSGDFDSGNLGNGGTYSRQFDEPGQYEYYCAIHPSMTGTVTVTDSEASASTPTVVVANPTSTPTSAPPTATPTVTPTAQTSTATPTPSPIPSPTPTESAGGEQYSADIENFQHEVIEITVGTTITWTNQDNTGHTVTSGTISGGSSGGPLSSGTMTSGDTYSYTFTEPGEFLYYCVFPHNMQGKVTVVEP